MDPISLLGLISTLSQLLDHSGKIADALSNYCSLVRHAPTRSRELREELVAISTILAEIKNLVESDPLDVLLPLPALRGAAIDFSDTLNYLEDKVRPACSQGFRRLVWPLSKTTIERTITRIERHKTTFGLALSVQHM